MHIELHQLAHFLVRAKRNTYASGIERNVLPQRPGFDELEYKEGSWEYRGSYYGFYRALGQEVVRFRGHPIWNMSYDGGMLPKFYGNSQSSEQTFGFLCKALVKVNESKPFRGPIAFRESKYKYVMKSEGTITSFKGTERILFRDTTVYIQNYIGGMIVDHTSVSDVLNYLRARHEPWDGIK